MTAVHRYRGPREQVLPFREAMRHWFGSARDGVVIEDLDVIIRVFDPRNGADIGSYRAVEFKMNPAWTKVGVRDRSAVFVELGHAQRMTFGPLDHGLRVGLEDRYLGLWVLSYPDDAVWTVHPEPVARTLFDDPHVAVEQWQANRFGKLVRCQLTQAVLPIADLAEHWGVPRG